VPIRSLREVLKAAVLAGLLAGLAAAGFHWIFTEPLIDRAVEMEESLHASAGAAHAEPVVGRPVQKLGLFIGFLLYGGAWGILFGLLAYAIGPWFTDVRRHGLFLSVLLGWAAAIFPLLKYPANPPGVGAAETIGYRRELFLVFIALSLLGTFAALGVERSLRRSRRARVIVLVLYLIYLVVIFLTMPFNPDKIRLPAGLVRDFRIFSLLGQLLFWTAMGGAFCWLRGKYSRSVPALE
jgi:predicted cobalt transporter CbtA